MNKKVILIVLDGLSYQVGAKDLGFMHGLVRENMASFQKMHSELPALSRPLYEAILTGVPPVKSGITANAVVKLSNNESLFSVALKANKTVATASYFWVRELYVKAPFSSENNDRFLFNSESAITNGIFYYDDSYPDSHVFADAEYVRCIENADFLYVHSMGIDNAGHIYSGDSKEYRNIARSADNLLALYLPKWHQLGYSIIVTSDHGMNADYNHNGLREEESEVPFFFYPKGNLNDYKLQNNLSQTQIAAFVCSLLGIKAADTMPKL